MKQITKALLAPSRRAYAEEVAGAVASAGVPCSLWRRHHVEAVYGGMLCRVTLLRGEVTDG